MFQATDHSKHAPDLPRGCTFADSDWHILSRFWHPVARAQDISKTPVAARLLDVDLVIWRHDAGISVARDICPHRGTRLTAGWVEGGDLVCPMHGLRYGGDGRCTAIPSAHDPTARIPPRLRLLSLLAEERYGLVWACLSQDPCWALPDWPGIGDPALRNLHLPVDTWQAAASRHVENFNDIAHFPFVHTGTFGGTPSASVPQYEVDETTYGLRFQVPYLEGFNRFPDDVPGDTRAVTYTYELTFPFSTIIIIRPEGSDYVQYFADAVCPVSAHESRIFQVAADSANIPDEDEFIRESVLINAEDKPMVEGQHPEDLPLDLREEVHIPADCLSVAYRRALAQKFGLGAPISS